MVYMYIWEVLGVHMGDIGCTYGVHMGDIGCTYGVHMGV